MWGLLLGAVVTYAAPDGVYLNEGAEAGVQVGDAVRVGRETLTVVSVAPHSSRTSAPHDPFAVKRGAAADFETPHPPGPPPEPDDEPRPAQAPRVDDAAAADLWAGAATAWAKPRPLPKAARSEQAEEAGPRYRGDLGLRATVETYDGLEGQTALYSRLGVQWDRWWYAHDLEGTYDFYDGRTPPPPLQVDRLAAGYEGGGWGARAGRIQLGEALASGSLDGASVGLDPVRVFAGLAPDPLDLSPALNQPQAGASARGTFAVGDFDSTAGVTTLVSGWRGSLDRLALAPDLRVNGTWLQLTGRAELDAYPTRTGGARPVVDATRLYAAARVEATRWLDMTARYDRYRAPWSLALIEAGGLYTQEARQTAWGDVRLRGGAFGDLRLSGGVLDDPRGPAWLPGVDYRLPLTAWLDARVGWLERAAPLDRLDQVRAATTATLLSPWPMEIELSGEWVSLKHVDQPEVDDTEWTGALGVWLSTPAGFDVRAAGEMTVATVSRATVFGDLRWRFGR